MPYSSKTPAHLLAELILEHRRLLRKDPSILTACDADLKHYLDELKRHNLVTITQLWRERERRLQGRDRTRTLDFLLRQLNDHYSKKSINRIETAHGTLILGHRWWQEYSRYQTLKNGRPRAGPAFDDLAVLPHMRLIQERGHRFISTAGHKGQFSAFNKQYTDGHPLRVGLVCFSGRAKTWFVGTEPLPREQGAYGFKASHVMPSEIFEAELKACLAWARKEKVHLLCLPELCISQTGRALLKREIEKNPGSLCLVFPGTFHEPDPDGSLANTAPVWLIAEKGVVELANYAKGSRFEMACDKAALLPNMEDALEPARKKGLDNLKEDIRLSREILLLSTPIGLMGVMICKDMLIDSITQGYLEHVDHMVVLSMNGMPTNIFCGKAESAARNHLTGSFYVNATQAVGKNEKRIEMAFWYPPVKVGGTDRRTFFYREPTTTHPLSKEGYVLFQVEKIPPELIK